VKRVAAVDSDRGMLSLLGDNPGASTDSRTFGPVPRHAVIGRVAFRYAPAERAGPVAGRPPLTAMGRSPR
ncbi:MAG: S26 family signal peptidase, partial [Actinomycetota bacterium]|nr:S26 family signal peptidase [Actinomycetota bacterium]